MTGRPPRFVRPAKAVLTAGSVIEHATGGTRVWGSGIADTREPPSPDATYAAVRGPLTREAIRHAGGAGADVLGDPALLLPRVYDPPREGPRHAVGVVRRPGAGAPASEGVVEISPLRVGHAEVEAFVDEILSCEVVLSATLHGVVVAHAYGIPARWCTFGASRAVADQRAIEFEDHLRAVGMPMQEPLDLSGIPVLDERLVRRADRTVELRFDGDRLVAALPGSGPHPA